MVVAVSESDKPHLATKGHGMGLGAALVGWCAYPDLMASLEKNLLQYLDSFGLISIVIGK
jgi:hypothetical protein